MNIGERYALAWKHPHRLEATVVELQADRIVADVVHRCLPTCEVLQMRQTLPIEGRLSYSYGDFAKLFQRMSDGIPLPAAS